MDTYHDEYWGDCAFDYVEILGQRYCGSSLPDPIISCNDLEVKFSSYIWRFGDNQGFRAVWTEIPDGSGLCLYSPPLTEGAECDYGQMKGPCEEGLRCTNGWCQG